MVGEKALIPSDLYVKKVAIGDGLEEKDRLYLIGVNFRNSTGFVFDPALTSFSEKSGELTYHYDIGEIMELKRECR